MNGKGGCIHLSILIQLFMFVKLYILNPDVPLQTVFIAFLLRGDMAPKLVWFVFFFFCSVGPGAVQQQPQQQQLRAEEQEFWSRSPETGGYTLSRVE